MFSIALSSLRVRASAFAASFTSVFFGAAILMSFASLIDSAQGARISSDDKSTLITMALVIGGWGLPIVAFGIAATSSLTVRQRRTEIALLKSAGATPAQIRRMIISEAAIVSLAAAVVAIPVAFFTGRAALSALGSAHEVAQGVGYHFGTFALSIGLGNTIIAAAVAAYVAARRASALSTRDALASAAVGEQRTSRKRIVFACIFLFAGIDCATLTATVLKNNGFVTMSVAGQAFIHTSIGLALLAPLLMRVAARLLEAPLRMLGGTSGYAAGIGIRQRAEQSAGVLMPVILFTGMATGGLYIQSMLNSTNSAAHLVDNASDKSVEGVNTVIVAMVAVFAAVVLVNNAVATMTYRKREFGQWRLAGTTPAQVMRMVGFETVVTVITGVIFGTVAALAGIVPYGIALSSKATPHVGAGLYGGVIAAVLVLTFAANLGATRRAIQPGALETVAVNV
jgi:putative ABC transport system permease protein